ncbi:guanine nucleotide binding protein, alpha subunit [Cyathus striatus]|nr:guanine nucleotide binding protein, alpha subunit [Cyathus striatus]
MVLGRRMSVAARLAKARSKEIDLRLQEDCKRATEVKVLLLGSDDAERSTIFKAIRMTHQKGLTSQYLEDYRPIVYRNLVDPALALVDYVTTVGVECENTSNQVPNSGLRLDPHSPSPSQFAATLSHPSTIPEAYIPGSILNKDVSLPAYIAHAIHKVWHDTAVRSLIDSPSSSFRLPERARYFFDNALRIGAPNYVPTETDVLRSRERTNGITEFIIPTSNIPIRVFTVGSHSPRQKWLQCFESVSRIVFCVSVGDYVDIVEDGQEVNRLQDSVVLFRSILSSRWFARSEVTLLLTDVDLLQRNLPKMPLDDAFPSYDGGDDIEKAKQFILGKFLDENRKAVNVHPCFVQRVDAESLRAALAGVINQV